MDVFDLAAKISLDTGPFTHSLGEAKEQMSSFKDVFKANIASDIVRKGFDGIVTGTKAVVGGLKNLVDQSQKAYGDYQQMVGGVQKLYGNMGKEWDEYAKMTGDNSAKAKAHYDDLKKAQDLVMKNAEKAYQTSGMSMNKYMETATQFSASLISSLGGDTQKAAKQTDIAMKAIADNFNTFGGNIEDVTNAFKGFSKQNYTMLDNLKLGYGGTKSEMEKLIKDANEWGKANGEASNLSIDSFSDVVTAIQQIQEKQQIAGTTAREASTTLQGSMGQMQAAWENLKTAMSDPKADLGKKVDELVETITGRAATAEDVAIGAATNIGDHINGYLDNLLPIVSQALDGVAKLIGEAGPIIAEQIPNILEKLIPPVLSAAANLADAVITNLPTLVQSIEDALSESFGTIGDPSKLAEKATEIISGLAGAITAVIPNLISVGAEILTALIQGITDNSQVLLDGAAQIITALGDGIIQNLPQIVSAVVELLQSFTEYITDHKDEIQSGVQALVEALVQGIITLTPDLTEAAVAIVTTLGGALIDAVPTIVEQLPTFISELMGAITDAMSNASPEGKVALAAVLAPTITGGISDAIKGVKDAKDTFSKLNDIFGEKGLFGNIKNIDFKGTAEAFGMLGDSLKTAAGLSLDSLKSFFSTVGSAIGSGLSTGVETLGSAFSTLGSGLASLGTTIGSGILTAFKSLGGAITGTVLPALVSFGGIIAPFLPLILGISAAIVGVILVIKNWDKVSAALKATWETLTGAAKKVFGGIKDTISGAWDKVKSSTSKKWKEIKGEVEKNGGGIKGVIKTAAKGWLKPWKAGFDALNKASGGKLGEAVEGVGKNLKDIQSKFKENNSKVKKLAKGLVDKVKEGWSGITKAGGDFVRGIWEGINDKVSWVVEKVKGFGKKVLNGLKDFFKIKSPSRVMRDQIGKNLALGVADGITKNTKYAKKSASEMGQAILDAANKKLEKYEVYHSLSLASEVAYWNKIRKEIKKGTEARLEADKNYLEKKKDLQEQERQANETLKSSLKDAESTYQQAIQSTIDKLTQRKNDILQAFNLFEGYDAGTGVSKNTLLANLDAQVKGLNDWEDQIVMLKKRIGNTDLFKSIEEMGVSGYQNVVSLNTMTDEELAYYQQQYQKLNDLADKQAHTELDSTVNKDQTSALKDYMHSVSDAYNTYAKTMDDMGVKVKKLPKSVKESLKRVGKDYTSVLDTMSSSTKSKMSNITGTIEKGFKKVSGKTKKYGADLVDNFIAGINSKEADLSDAIVKKIAKKVKKYIGFSEPEAGPLSNFHTFAPDMIDLFVNGIERNGSKIGEAFDKNLGIEDVSGRIANSMTIPAGNTLSIDGIPNLTEIKGQSQQNQPINLNIVMKVGRQEFAKLVYEANREETQRVGVSLATGTI